MSDTERFTTVGELRELLAKYPDDQPVLVGIPEEDNRCYLTEFDVEEHTVWLGPAVVIAPCSYDEESNE